MPGRFGVPCVLLAAVVAGLLFVPVFGVTALLAPLLVPAVALFAVAQLCARTEVLAAWRPLLLLVAGLLAVVETVLFSTTVAGLPTGETFSALASGITESWRLTLQSTWPARPSPDQLLFVPLLALPAGVLGIELLLRSRKPLVALIPSFAVVVVSQLYVALSGLAAVAAGLGYAAVAGALFALTRPGEEKPASRAAPAFASGVPVVLLGLAAAVAAGMLLPAPGGPAYSLKQDQPAQVSGRVTGPLDDIAHRLEHPGVPMFSVRGDARPDRWPLVVLDAFDGVNWTPGSDYRRLGVRLPPSPSVAVPSRERTAAIRLGDLGGPWLPSQTWPAAVSGADPLVEEAQGSLWLPRPPGEYRLSWWEPQVPVADLAAAAIDPRAPGGLGAIGEPPADVETLARSAVGGLRPSFQAALTLERFFREGYRTAAGTGLPSGHGWPQLRKFLFETRRGTSEQFAAAYVALARIVGIPARLVVGFRSPAEPDAGGGYTVRNGDVLAWPEVAVAGAGWVPLDPAGATRLGGAGGPAGLSEVTAQARAQLPPATRQHDAPLPAVEGAGGPGGADTGDRPFPVLWVLAGPVALLPAWLVGVPLAKFARSRRRRRRAGAGAVLGAWLEVRDRLRDHRVPWTAGMTARDLAAAARGIGSPSIVDGLRALGGTVDQVLWSGDTPGAQAGSRAWAAVRTVRRGLAGRGLRVRLRAALDPRTLLVDRHRTRNPGR
ncbi:transglutaminase TgpA family protein [Amycolatopsis vastitatis]|uniref:Transglutaminase n=1 Tax=Amycolatopsis vastitatis TaxID=1905142 RepID=A0A229SP50_9PSEU|nr:transglutaminaseTgpA domain-containing protein [Amycolatopsis vastitatis]OXM60815.1 transglutaminase [Amycolatopsis vastitatis]